MPGWNFKEAVVLVFHVPVACAMPKLEPGGADRLFRQRDLRYLLPERCYSSGQRWWHLLHGVAWLPSRHEMTGEVNTTVATLSAWESWEHVKLSLGWPFSCKTRSFEVLECKNE